MRILHRMVVRSFVPVFVAAVAFFVLVIQLMDLFANLWRYFAHEAMLAEIGRIALLYVPKCVSYSIPVALMFSISYSLGTMYAHNELIAVFGSGVSLFVITLPFVAISLLFSVGGFFFEDNVVIPTFKMKNELYAEVVKQTVSYSNSNVTVISGDYSTLYQIDYYNDSKQTLTGVLVLLRGDDNRFQERIDAQWGQWSGKHWTLHECRVFRWDAESASLTEASEKILEATYLREEPFLFRKQSRNIEEMGFEDSYRWVNSLRNAGVPDKYRAALTEYYQKFSMALTPLIVAMISSSLGSAFKKNILLMCLLSSLVITVVYYVAQMVAVLLAKNGYIPPVVGAWTAFALFLIVGLSMFRTART